MFWNIIWLEVSSERIEIFDVQWCTSRVWELYMFWAMSLGNEVRIDDDATIQITKNFHHRQISEAERLRSSVIYYLQGFAANSSNILTVFRKVLLESRSWNKLLVSHVFECAASRNSHFSIKFCKPINSAHGNHFSSSECPAVGDKKCVEAGESDYPCEIEGKRYTCQCAKTSDGHVEVFGLFSQMTVQAAYGGT